MNSRAGCRSRAPAGGIPLLATLWLLWVPAKGVAQAGVYLTEQAAIREVFPAAALVSSDTIRLDDSTRAALENRLGRELASEYLFRRVYAGATDAPSPVGYSLMTEEQGQYRAITMLVGVDRSGRVAGVRILVYREPRGGGVARQSFLRQYRGKQVGDSIRVNRDIINVAGSTISVHLVNAGVRKTLALIECCLRTSPRTTSNAPRPLSEVP